MKKITTAEFIQRAQVVHGNLYDYRLVEYKSGKEPVTIICKIHGKFSQLPENHVRLKCGCPTCGRNLTGRKKADESAKTFITRSVEVHGQRYDYRDVDYKTNSTKVKIICKVHGPFLQQPNNHLQGNGCPRCGVRKGATSVEVKDLYSDEIVSRHLDTKAFIQRSQSIFGAEYDYSKTKYVSSNHKVKIRCRVHGIFEIMPNAHLGKPRGCPTCGREKAIDGRRTTFEEFLAQARSIHGDKYSYNEKSFKNMHRKIEIKCPTHGKFLQQAHCHAVRGQGCAKCAGLVQDTTDFLRKAREVHGRKYDYSDSIYKLSTEPVTIKCKEHGLFKQTPSKHLSGQGCPACGLLKLGKLFADNTENFIAKAREMHGENTYDYSQVEYINSHTKVIIGCRKHGPFEMKPNNHVNHQGCPICSINRGEREIAKWLKQHRFEFIQLWRDHDLFGTKKRKLEFDFVLKDLNIIIEFDGEQHHRPVRWHRSESPEKIAKRFAQIQLYDDLKNKWARKNGFKMIRVRYDEDIGSILKKRLSKFVKAGNM